MVFLTKQWLQKAADDGFPCYSLFLREHNLENFMLIITSVILYSSRRLWEPFNATL
jgi:hypothetical protein